MSHPKDESQPERDALQALATFGQELSNIWTAMMVLPDFWADTDSTGPVIADLEA